MNKTFNYRICSSFLAFLYIINIHDFRRFSFIPTDILVFSSIAPSVSNSNHIPQHLIARYTTSLLPNLRVSIHSTERSVYASLKSFAFLGLEYTKSWARGVASRTGSLLCPNFSYFHISFVWGVWVLLYHHLIVFLRLHKMGHLGSKKSGRLGKIVWLFACAYRLVGLHCFTSCFGACSYALAGND